MSVPLGEIETVFPPSLLPPTSSNYLCWLSSFKCKTYSLLKLDLANRNKCIQQWDIFSSAMHHNYFKEDVTLKRLKLYNFFGCFWPFFTPLQSLYCPFIYLSILKAKTLDNFLKSQSFVILNQTLWIFSWNFFLTFLYFLKLSMWIVSLFIINSRQKSLLVWQQ